MSADTLERMTCARACPIFGHFDTPSHEIHETTGGWMKEDRGLAASAFLLGEAA